METLKEARGSQYGLQTVTKEPSYIKNVWNDRSERQRGKGGADPSDFGKKWIL